VNAAVFNSVDCSRCELRPQCGTLPTAGIWGCYDHCLTKCDPATCDFTCPQNPRYTERWWEVGGMGPVRLETVPNTAALTWPTYLPVVFGKYARELPASVPCVVVPLAALFRQRRNGDIEPIARDPASLRARFCLRPNARVFASGVGPDADIEWLWHHHDIVPLGKMLHAMGIEAATAPNYSYFAYAPRDHYLWNRKRMLLFVSRLARDRFPVVPHLYGETKFDWMWWARYYFDHPELTAFAVELQTSDAFVDRLPDFLDNLRIFRERVGRDLTAFVVGGRHAARAIAEIFPQLVIAEASSYMKTVRRRMAMFTPDGQLRWRKVTTNGGIDSLFEHNTRAIGESITAQIAAARAHRAKTRTAAA
jgi:hypothetical protein